MASLQLVKGSYHICFRFNGRRFKRSLKTAEIAKADARRVRLEETLGLVETGRLEIPDDVSDVAAFLLTDGKLKKRKAEGNGLPTPPPRYPLQQMFDEFFAAIPPGNLEDSTLRGMHRHEGHLLKLLGSDYPIRDLTVDMLQQYVNKRAKEKTHYGTFVQPNTIHKELVTLGTVWRWAERLDKVVGTFPRRGVRLPKSDELPPFQTWDEIERQINFGGLTAAEESVLWDALYLRRTTEGVEPIKLTQLKPISTKVGYGSFAINQRSAPHVSRGARPATEFIFAHAPSRVVYAIPRGIRSFTATGYNDCSRSAGFEVYACQTLLHSFTPELGAVTIAVDIPANTKTLQLVTTNLGDGERDHTFWVMPRLHRRPIADVEAGRGGKPLLLTTVQPVDHTVSPPRWNCIYCERTRNWR